LVYAHDTYGLGHLRRTLAIAGHLTRAIPDLNVLLLTGSPIAHNFPMPPRTDYVKLPSVIKTDDEQYRARDLDVSLASIVGLRAALIADAARLFAPDLVLVDHAPLGMKGEILPALRALRRSSPSTRIVLGLRDVIDEPRKIRKQWTDHGVYAAVAELYDRVFVYGQADFFDPVEAYAFPPALAARTRFCGYIQREDATRSSASLKSELGLQASPFVLVTTGGGGDGITLEETCLDAWKLMHHASPTQLVVIAGPLLAPPEQARLERLALEAGPAVRLLRFHPDVPGLLRACSLVVAMGGYNTICEIVSAGCPAVVVPRAHPRLEQHIRAQAFAARGLVQMLPARTLSTETLADAMRQAVRQGGPSRQILSRWNSDGLRNIASEFASLLSTRRTQKAA
jgi:predicted glycosyltransferase